MGKIGSIRHLLYHLYPNKAGDGGKWRQRVKDLRARLSLFNGRRIVGVATGPETDSLDAVKEAFGNAGVRFIEKRNSRDMRETSTLLALYEGVQDCVGKEHVTLHAHGKGVTSEAWGRGVARWVEALHETCLDHWPVVEEMLQEYPIVGAFKRQWSNWRVGSFKSKSTWHFSGSWRWFRNADLFVRNWRYIEPFWCGSESHPSMIFRDDEAGNLVCPIDVGGQALYTDEFWRHVAGPAMDTWRRVNAPRRVEPLLLSCVLTSHRKPVYVREAIASVQNQTADSWELIVMDSGSLARELRPLELDPRIKVVSIEESDEQRATRCGQGCAINEAFRRDLVRGDLVCYLSDDDVYEPSTFAAWIEHARANPEEKAWAGRAERVAIRPCGRQVPMGLLLPVPVGSNPDCNMDGMQLCVRRASVVHWPEERAHAWHADGLMMARLAATTSIHPVNVCVGRHRHTPASTFTRTRGTGLVSSHTPLQ